MDQPCGVGVRGVALLGFEPRVVKTVEITAHRGSSARAPENTLAAVRQAIADGCDFIEIDVQTCADGAVVVVHDRNLLRVAGDARRVEDLTLAELRRMDVGRWFSSQFTGEHVPTLEEVLDLVRGKVRLNIELKYNRPDPNLVPAVLERLRRGRFLGQCVLTSMDPAALCALKTAEPAACTGLILRNAVGRLSRMQGDFLSVAVRRVTAAFVDRAHRAGKPVHVWTVNKPAAMARMIELGVDNLITDVPAVLRGVIEARRKPLKSE